MGAGGSKPADTGSATKHVFTSETPIQFSQGLVESLQSSSETDSSRAQTIELHIQARVAEELQRIRARETQTLADLEKKLAPTATAKESSTKSATPAATSSLNTVPLSLESPRIPFAGPGSIAESANATPAAAQSEGAGGVPELSSAHVSKEVEALREKLASRPAVRKLDDGVEKARGQVVNCLRQNEKRPLDCWQEVGNFKQEVARMERDWVEKVIR